MKIEVISNSIVVEKIYERTEIKSIGILTGKEIIENELEIVSQTWQKINKSSIHLAVYLNDGTIDLFSKDCEIKIK